MGKVYIGYDKFLKFLVVVLLGRLRGRLPIFEFHPVKVLLLLLCQLLLLPLQRHQFPNDARKIARFCGEKMLPCIFLQRFGKVFIFLERRPSSRLWPFKRLRQRDRNYLSAISESLVGRPRLLSGLGPLPENSLVVK